MANALAESNALYAAARAASASFLVVPLEPNGTRPMAPLSEATNNDRQLYAWWASEELKDCNPGILLGRIGNAVALQVDNMTAYSRLRELATVTHHDEDADRGWRELREIGGYSVRLVKPEEPFMSQSIIGWGKAYTRAVAEMDRERRTRNPETFALVWSYPSISSGQDAFSYKNRKVGEGLTLMAEGALPWDGAILEGMRVFAPKSRPPEVPAWLGALLGHVRSRREMAAAREAWESIQRRDNAHVAAAIAARRTYEDQECEQADKDREQAERVLAEVMAKDS